MKLNNRWVQWTSVVLAVASLHITAYAAPGSGKSAKDAPAQVQPIGESGLSNVILTARAVERLGIATATVSEVKAQKIVPYGSVLYDVNGGTWVYTNPQPLTYVRHSIAVSNIEGSSAILSQGPPLGTMVVTHGAVELYGTETGIGK